MQAEEYDLSFRLIASGYSIQRFWDMHLMHLKSPGARIGQRTTRLDVRNNLYLLAKYLPDSLCHPLAADWLARYWLMARQRDAADAPHALHGTHKQAFLRGAAQGLSQWSEQRQNGSHLLPPEAIERIFKFDAIERRLARLRDELQLRRIAFADFGKNLFAYYRAATRLGLEVVAVLDDQLAGEFAPLAESRCEDYRGIPIVGLGMFTEGNLGAGRLGVDALILTTMSPVHAQRRMSALGRIQTVPVIDPLGRGVRRGGDLWSQAGRDRVLGV
jgi:hypothetical protein